ncbi:MAG: putative peroxidase-related enzyme [Paracoccaceae bacterium]
MWDSIITDFFPDDPKKGQRGMTHHTTSPTALDLPQVDPLPPETQKYFDICVEKLGFVPNVLRAYAFDIKKLNAFTGLYNDLMLAPSGLSKLDREMIAVVVSSVNKCFYCLVAHGQAVRALSGKPELGEMLAMNYRVAPITDKERAMLDFAVAMTVSSATIKEADRQALRDAGFTEHDIWDIIGVAGLYNMTNRVASATNMQPNAEYHSLNR